MTTAIDETDETSSPARQPRGRWLPNPADWLGLSDDERPAVVGWIAGIAAFLVFVFVIYPAPLAILTLGAILGMLSALVAMGLVLVYRANRIVNFAQGDIGGMAAVLTASLIVGPDWGFFPAVLVGFAAALILGGLTEVLIIRRFAKAPRLILTVATIGLAQLFQVGQLLLPRLFDYDVAPQPPDPFPFVGRLEWFPVTFRGGHVLIVVAVPLVAIALSLFFRRTRVGIAVRAAAERTDRAELLGIPVKRINTLVWVLAAGMSGLGVLLRMPIQGVSIGQVLGPSLLLRALAAAVIGRMENLPRTFAAAVILSIMEQAVFFETGSTIVADAVLFGIIIGGLLLQKGGIVQRALDAGASTWGDTREIRPIPRELWALPIVRYTVFGIAGFFSLLLLYLPLTWAASSLTRFSVGVIFAMVILSLVILTGWAGQISLGHFGLFIIGAAVTGTLAQQGKNFFFTLLVAALVVAAVSTAIGIPALRIRGPFFAVTTLAFNLATVSFFLNEEYFDWLVPDTAIRVERPVIFDKFDLESEWTYYYVILIFFFLVVAAVSRLRTSRTGRTMVANRDNSRAAQSYSISPIRAQLTAFALSGFIVGLAGALYTYELHGVSPNSAIGLPENSIKLFSMGVIGGLGSIPGALLGAAYLTFVDFSSFTVRQESRLLASGVGVTIILLFLPGGLGNALYSARDAILRAIARSRNIVVPSLLADVRTLEQGEDAEADEDRPARGAVSEPSDDALLVVRDLEVSYGKTQVLFGVNFHVERGEIVALLGTNGAGKSTLLSAISGLVRPMPGRDLQRLEAEGGPSVGTWFSERAGRLGRWIVGIPRRLVATGRGIVSFVRPAAADQDDRPEVDAADIRAGMVVYDGHDITGAPPQVVVSDGMVLMPGGKGTFPTLTVGENLKLAAWLYDDDEEYVEAAIERVLDYFPVLRERWDQRAGNLSGGEQQMLTLGQVFILKPRLLMIDELSLGLAPVVVEQLLGIVRAVHEAGTTIVLVEQSVNVAITLAERAVFMEKGEVRFDGPTADLLDRPDVLRAVFLDTGAAPASGNGHRAFVGVCDHCGHEHPVSLELNEVSVSFGGVRAVNDVSVEVREGQILGIIGGNGAGKTTLLDTISGFVTPVSGRVRLFGQDVTDLAPPERAALGLGRSFQDARLFPAMTVRQTIATALERHVPVPDPIAAFLLSPAVRTSEKWVDEEVSRLIELMNLDAFADKFIGELSTGSRRIVDLACTLAHGPKVLLLDEPSSGIAQRETEALGPVLIDIRDKTGAALIVIEHDMPLITGISDQLIALEAGTLIASGTPDEVINDPQVVEGYLGGTEEVIQRSGGGTAKEKAGAKKKRVTATKKKARRTPLRARPRQ